MQTEINAIVSNEPLVHLYVKPPCPASCSRFRAPSPRQCPCQKARDKPTSSSQVSIYLRRQPLLQSARRFRPRDSKGSPIQNPSNSRADCVFAGRSLLQIPGDSPQPTRWAERPIPARCL